MSYHSSMQGVYRYEEDTHYSFLPEGNTAKEWLVTVTYWDDFERVRRCKFMANDVHMRSHFGVGVSDFANNLDALYLECGEIVKHFCKYLLTIEGEDIYAVNDFKMFNDLSYQLVETFNYFKIKLFLDGVK